MAAQMVGIQPLKRALGGNIYLELTEWNGSKKVDLRFWKNGTVPTKEGVSLHLDQWKVLCNMSDVIDDLLTSHRKRTSRVAIPYQRRRFSHHQGTVSLRAHQKVPYSLLWMDPPSYQERCGFALWRMERIETDHPIVGRKRARTETVTSLYRTDL